MLPSRSTPASTSSVPPNGGPRIGVAREGCQEHEVRRGIAVGRARFVLTNVDSRGVRTTIRPHRGTAARWPGHMASSVARREAVRRPLTSIAVGWLISTHASSIFERDQPTRCSTRMPTLTEGAILDALRTVQEPELGRDIVTLNMVKDIVIDDARVAMTIELTTPACPLKDEIEGNAQAALDEHRRRDGRAHLGRDGPARRAAPGASSSSRTSRTSSPSRPARAASARARSRQSGRRAGPGRRRGGPARRGHHRPQHPA